MLKISIQTELEIKSLKSKVFKKNMPQINKNILYIAQGNALLHTA